MIVPFIFENETEIKEKPAYLWVFYKFSRFCLNNNLPIIALEDYYKKPSFYKKINHPAASVMDLFNINDQSIKKLKKYKITNKEKNESNYKKLSEYDYWISLLTEQNDCLEKIITKKLDEIEENENKKIEAVIVWSSIKTLENICKKRKINLINVEYSGIRNPVYQQILYYFSLNNKYDINKIDKKIIEFKNIKDIPILSHTDLLALLLDKKYISFIKELNNEPIYKYGYALGPNKDCFQKIYSKYKEKETITNLKKIVAANKISLRFHPRSELKIEKSNVNIDKSNHSIEWILKCENIICDISNIGTETLLLNRNLISINKHNPSAFNRENKLTDLTSIDNLEKINFLLFYWYVPEKLICDYDYIKWRLTNPPIKEIYLKNLETIMGIDNIEDYQNNLNNSTKYVLEKRNINIELIDDILSNKNNLKKYNSTISDHKKEINNLNKIIENQNKNLNELSKKNNILNNEINNLLNSKSWKITKLLRIISSLKNKNNLKENIIEESTELKESYENYNSYDSNYEENIEFTNCETDIKTIVFHLPQFHTFKENDEWWGKGFTEWTNVKKAKPQFEGHYQPRIPHKDIGYYTLDNKETLKKQMDLAKQHGIYGFCYYYYWFSGKRLMEKAIDIVLNNKDLDFPFCLCWANESWSRTWNNKNNEILIKQNDQEEDYYNFIKDIKKYLIDKRYIKIDNKPVLIIYNPKQIKNFKKMIEIFRQTATKEQIGELYIIIKSEIVNSTNEYEEYVDAQYDFPPHGISIAKLDKENTKAKHIFNYKKIIEDTKHLYKNHIPNKSFFYTTTLGWDNTARRKENYTIYHNYSNKMFYEWLKLIIEETRIRNPIDKRIMFVNAWNEWAEGTYLEPDKKYGYKSINTLSKAIYDINLED